MCQVNLGDFVTGTSGGVTLQWSETETCDCPSEVNSNPSSPLLTGGSWTTNDSVDFSGADPGTYYFSYRTGNHCSGCEDCNVLEITIEDGPQENCGAIIEACDPAGCDGDNEKDVYQHILDADCFFIPVISSKANLIALFSSTGTCTGELTDSGNGGFLFEGEVNISGGCPSAFDCSTGILDPCGCGDSTVTLEFIVRNPNGDDDCDTCETTFYYVYNISEGNDAGNPQNPTLCN